MDQFTRRSTFGVLGAGMLGTASNGSRSENKASHRTVAYWGIDVRAYGAVADDATDNAAAFEAATAAAVAAGRPLFIPAAGKPYRTSRTLQLATGIVGEGRGSVIKALSADAFRGGKAIVRIGSLRAENPVHCTVPVTGIRVMGAGKRPVTRGSDPKATGFEGVGILLDETAAFIHFVDVGVEFCQKGIVHGNRNGHIGGTNVICANNWYNLYWERNSGDFRYFDCMFSGALFATYGCHGSRRDDENVGGITGLTIIGCHGGFSPFLFYQEDGDGSVGLVGWTSINSSSEQIGNQVIRLGRTPTGTPRVCSDWFIVAAGHSWTSPDTPEHGAYAIRGQSGMPVQEYAIDLDLVQGGAIEVHGNGWVPGQSGRHTRIKNLLAWVADDSGVGGYEVTGGGVERLTYMRAPRLRQPRSVDFKIRGGTTHEIAQFEIPPSYDNTPGGEMVWTLAYTANATPAAFLQFFIRIEGDAATPDQPLVPQAVTASMGNLSGSQAVSIGRRDRAKATHRARLFVQAPVGLDGVSVKGSVALIIGQDIGVVG